MEHSALAEHIRDTAVRHLTEANEPITPEAIEAKGRWLIALWHAEQVSNGYTIKDIACLFLDGLKPIGTIDEECKDLTDEDLDEDQSAEFIDFINLL